VFNLYTIITFIVQSGNEPFILNSIHEKTTILQNYFKRRAGGAHGDNIKVLLVIRNEAFELVKCLKYINTSTQLVINGFHLAIANLSNHLATKVFMCCCSTG